MLSAAVFVGDIPHLLVRVGHLPHGDCPASRLGRPVDVGCGRLLLLELLGVNYIFDFIKSLQGELFEILLQELSELDLEKAHLLVFLRYLQDQALVLLLELGHLPLQLVQSKLVLLERRVPALLQYSHLFLQLLYFVAAGQDLIL